MKNESNKKTEKLNTIKQRRQAKETKNLNLEIQQNLESLFREFQSFTYCDIAELKIFELKVSVLKEILKMNIEIDKKTENATNFKTKETIELGESSFISTDLVEIINEALYNKILSTEADEEIQVVKNKKTKEQYEGEEPKHQEDSAEII